MCFILRICMGLGLLIIYVHGQDILDPKYVKFKTNQMETEATRLVTNGLLIGGMIRLSSAQPIGGKWLNRVYKGQNMSDYSEVAVKCYGGNDVHQREYEMYFYLNAVPKDKKDEKDKRNQKDKKPVEHYGISRLYYYEKNENFPINVFPLYECSLWEMKKIRKIEFLEIDYLIIFRDFVRTSKYVHRRGIRHNNVNAHNIMIGKGRSFLIDFSLSSKLKNNKWVPRKSALLYAGYRKLAEQDPNLKNFPSDDWGCFLYTMANIMDVQLNWIQQIKDEPDCGFELLCVLRSRFYKDLGDIIERIENHFEDNDQFVNLKEVMIEFAKESFNHTNKQYPNYNRLDDLIMKKIDKVNGKNRHPAVFSWLNGEAKTEAINYLNEYQPIIAKKIKDPIPDFEKISYKNLEYNRFENPNPKMLETAKRNHEAWLKVDGWMTKKGKSPAFV